MNERIRELAEQAKAESSQWLGSKPGITMAYDELEKFAELIVDECCVKLLDMNENARGNHNYYKHAALEIGKHFKGTL